MENQRPDVNTSRQNIDMDQDVARKNVETSQESRSGRNEQSANVTGAGETSRSADTDDIGNPKADTGRAETGRADTDMNSDLSSDS